MLNLFYKSNQWNKLKSLITKAIKQHIFEIKSQSPDLFGYALVPGEPYEINSLFPISVNHSNFEDIISYSPNEWPHCHDDFNEVVACLEELNTEFRQIHQPVNTDDCEIDNVEQTFINHFHQVVLSALSDLKQEGVFNVNGKDVFVLIWFSDQGIEGIIEDSVKQLNTSEQIEGFTKEMEEWFV